MDDARQDGSAAGKTRRRAVTLREGDAIRIGEIVVRRVSARKFDVLAPDGQSIDVLQRPAAGEGQRR